MLSRRQFLKRASMTAVAIAVAPVVLEEFASGGIVSNVTSLVGESGTDCFIPRATADAFADYYSIQWPATSRTWEFGTFIGDGLMEHKVFFENGSHTAYIPPAMELHFRSENLEAFCQYVDEHGKRTPPTKLYAYDIDVLKHDTGKPSHDA